MDIEYIQKCLTDINKIYGDIFLTSNFCRTDNKISWGRYKPGIYSKLLYAKEYEMLVDNRQYSFLMNDKSFFQFFFEFEGDDVSKAKLCYYPYPIANQEDSEALQEYLTQSGIDILESYYFGLSELKEIGVVSSNSSHFRLDYDHKVETHCKSHAQYGAINNLRIPFNHLINPLLFFEFVIQNTYESSSEMIDEIQSKDTYKTCLREAKEKIITISEEKGFHLQFVV